MNDVHFSRKSDGWASPIEIFEPLNREFNFELDVCASADNAKCDRFIDREQDGLVQEWAGRNWCNPPYSKLRDWIFKAHDEQAKGRLTVMLIPARTDTRAFHECIYRQSNVEVRFIKGRLRFVGAPYTAPFPSMVVIFYPHVVATN